MTRRRDIENHRQKLHEIRDIMNSMKTLAYLETHKLARLIQAQHKLNSNIEQAAIDFLNFYPDVLPSLESTENHYLLIGSQRGFCGNYNEVLAEHFRLALDSKKQHPASLIAIGQKLHEQLKDLPFDINYIEGANVTEEIDAVVDGVAHSLMAAGQPVTSLYVLYHETEDNNVVSERLLPPFMQVQRQRSEFNNPPMLNLSATRLFIDLTENYLFTALHRVLYDSLMSENQSRVQHLENAVNHLDDKTSDLQRQVNALRQEEIIEEIEVILLNSPLIA
jgi:F-type H+-transporting ATPase subunit gamma